MPAIAEKIYANLMKDPDLDIPEGESRESAAWNETSQRMRQHKTNAKALALAAEVSESTAVEKLNNFKKFLLIIFLLFEKRILVIFSRFFGFKSSK